MISFNKIKALIKQTVSTKREKANTSRRAEFVILEQVKEVKETTFSSFSTSFIVLDPKKSNQLMSSAIQDPAYEYHLLRDVLNTQLSETIIQVGLDTDEISNQMSQQNESTIFEQDVQTNADSQTLRDANSLELVHQLGSNQFINDNYASFDLIIDERASILVPGDAFDLTQDARSSRQLCAFRRFIDNYSSSDLIQNERSSILVVRDPSSLADKSNGFMNGDFSSCDLIQKERSSILLSRDTSTLNDCKMSFQVSNEIFV